jgi:N-acetylneuraminic acid mutarotase
VDAAAAIVVNSKLYVIGGGSAAGPTGAVQIYDPASGSWSAGAPMPTARLSAAVAVIDGKIYIAGGQTAGIGTTAVLERYNPATNRWVTLASMPAAREALGGGWIGGRFCVFGGRRASANPTGDAFATTFCYQRAANDWERGPDMLTPRAEVASAYFSGAVHAFGGRTRSAFATRTHERLH